MVSGAAAPCPIRCHAQASPGSLALWAPDRRWSYAELDAATEATSARLRTHGIEERSRVSLRLSREPHYVILLWALWRMGAVAVPLSTRLPRAEAERAARRVGTACMLTDRDEHLGGQTRDVEVYSADKFVRAGGKGSSGASVRPIARPATVVFTSGSTGTPTAVLHSWANHLYSAKGSNANILLRSGDRWLLSLPLYHVGGLAILVRCALAGAAVAVPDRKDSVPGALARSGATHASLVSTQLRRLLDEREGGAPDRLRALLLGGGPIPDGLLRRGDARGWPLHTSYGSTEMASQITTTSPGAPLDDLRTAGRRLPHRRVQIGDDGQILVSGATLCLGFVEGGQIQDVRQGGWYPTGDVGHLDARGRLHVRGRVDRQFVSGGENIQPEEVEAALEGLDRVERAVVVPVFDEEYGRRPVGFVRTASGGIPSGWEDTLETVLPRFKIPDDVHELPPSALQGRMKVDQEQLRRRAQKLRDRGGTPPPKE